MVIHDDIKHGALAHGGWQWNNNQVVAVEKSQLVTVYNYRIDHKVVHQVHDDAVHRQGFNPGYHLRIPAHRSRLAGDGDIKMIELNIIILHLCCDTLSSGD